MYGMLDSAGKAAHGSGGEASRPSPNRNRQVPVAGAQQRQPAFAGIGIGQSVVRIAVRRGPEPVAVVDRHRRHAIAVLRQERFERRAFGTDAARAQGRMAEPARLHAAPGERRPQPAFPAQHVAERLQAHRVQVDRTMGVVIATVPTPAGTAVPRPACLRTIVSFRP